ncbi:MAG: GLUG motif-containing protein, partial [Eubacteriales bacterium]|nr:GLUG motif-containing protein [Eubacterium sp.]MDY5494006.1 GLUG motif-containing protein [Eubacteriales bacterium]
WYKDAVAYGLVASLKEGGVVEGLTVELNVTMDNPGNQYTYFGGIVGLLDGGTIRDCKVTGTIDGYNRIGGVVGYAKAGTIEKVNVDVTIKARMHDDAKNDKKDNYKYTGYAVAGGIIGYESAGTVEIKDCTVKAVLTRMLSDGTTVIPKNLEDSTPSSDMKGLIVGQLDTWKNTGKGGYTTAGYTEWDATGSATKLNLTNVTVNDAVLKDADKTKTNLFGTHQSDKFATRITIA